MNAQPGFRQFSARNKTPPYASSIPEVQHRRLYKSVMNKLIVATDGLRDLYKGRLAATEDLIKRWVHVVIKDGDRFGGHKTLSLASDGLGEDLERIHLAVPG